MVTVEALKEIFEKIFDGELDLSNVTEKSSLVNDLGMNSVGMLYTAMALEEVYGIQFENSDFTELKTVGDVIKKIESLV